MKQIRNFLSGLIVLTCLLHSETYAQNPPLWKRLKDTEMQQLKLNKKPDAFAAYQLDKAEVSYFLRQTSTTRSKNNVLSLPDPTGDFRDFEVFETPVLPPELQAEYPQIRTYTAICIKDKNTTAKITMGTLGINIVVYSLNATYFITPVNDNDDAHYLAFNKIDYKNGFAKINCEINDELNAIGKQIRLGSYNGGTKLRSNGQTRRKFRCAIACTGEWANNVMNAPTIPGLLSHITTAINGANGVFERELAVTLEFVPQETSLIHINPATDPYSTTTNKNILLNENQNSLDAVLTNSGYDIGHLLSNAGGGIAAPFSICRDASKARGLSESLWPGDFGEIIHEMGHQFGSKHVFNSNQGFCNGNGYAPSAYEPGSGSTIMSYPFVCGLIDNVLMANTDYYHVYSLDNITIFINNPINITCGGILSGAASPIDIDTTPQEFYIPVNTPFELTAPEAQFSDVGAAINYCWEQWDLGNFGNLEFNAPNWTEGPTFQSFDPTVDRTRSFPRIINLLENNYGVTGERLSRVVRDLKFRLTARSLKDGWGTYNSDKKVTVHVTALDSFRVTAPNDGALWNVGAIVPISWNPGGSTLIPVNCNMVNIYLSPDGGRTFPYLIGSNVPNNGSFNFTVMDIYSDSVIIKVKGANNIFFDISKPFNKIHGSPTSIAENPANKNVTIYPNPANGILTIDAKEKSNAYTYYLMDISGKILKSGMFTGSKKIDINNFADGVYMLRLADEYGGTVTNKIIKKQ